MKPRLKLNKIILAAKIISFNFRRDVSNEMLILAAKIILFPFRRGSMLK